MEGPSSTTDAQASRKSGWDGEFQWQPLFWCHWHHAFLDIDLSSSQVRHTGFSSAGDAGTYSDVARGRPLRRPCSPHLCSQQLGQWIDKKGQGVGPCLVLSGPDLLRGQMLATFSTSHGFHLLSPACFMGSWELVPEGSVHTNSWPAPEVCLFVVSIVSGHLFRACSPVPFCSVAPPLALSTEGPGHHM